MQKALWAPVTGEESTLPLAQQSIGVWLHYPDVFIMSRAGLQAETKMFFLCVLPSGRLSTDQWNGAKRRNLEMMGRSSLLVYSHSCTLPTQILLWANPLPALDRMVLNLRYSDISVGK